MTASEGVQVPGTRARYLPFLKANPRFLAFGFALTFCSGFGQTYFLSTFGEAIRGTFDLTASQWGMFYGIATAGSAFALMALGPRIDDMPLRSWTTRVVAGLALACLLMAATPFAAALLVGLFAMRLAGQGLMGHTASTSMARYFNAERGRALTISGLGFAVGFAVFPRLGIELQKHLDWRVAWLVLSGVTALGVLPLLRMLLRGHGVRHAAWQARVTLQAEAASLRGANPDAAAHLPTPRRQWVRAEVLRDWHFYALLPGILACPAVMTGMIFFHDDLALAKGWSKEYLAGALAAVGIALYVTSLIVGRVVDRVGPRPLVALTQVPLIFGLLTVGLVGHKSAAVIYLACAGMTMGSMGPVIGSLWPSLYGTLHLGSIRALASAAMGLSTAAAPWGFGLLLDRGVSMPQIALGSAVYTLLGACLAAVAASRHRRSADPA